MDWKSRLAGFREVPGTGDPVVFRYPARSHSAVILAAGAVAIAIGLLLSPDRFDTFAYAVGIPMLLGGLLFVGLGTLNLLIVRRIEIHRSAKKLVDLRHAPLKKRVERAYDFADIRMISITRSEMEDGIDEVVVIELKSGDHVDFGSYSGEEGTRVAGRLQDLTGARMGW